MSFRVIVSKSNLQFAASHFITYGGKCELLHGHNYGLSLEIEGGLTSDSFVFDFVSLKKIARVILETLDHHFLLAMKNPYLKLPTGRNQLGNHLQRRPLFATVARCTAASSG